MLLKASNHLAWECFGLELKLMDQLLLFGHANHYGGSTMWIVAIQLFV